MSHNLFLILLLFPFLSLAESQQLATHGDSSEQNWRGKIEMEAKSTQNKNHTQDGYSLKTDSKIYYGNKWGLVGGFEILKMERKDSATTQTVDAVSFGSYFNFHLENELIKSYLVFNNVPDENLKQQDHRNGSVEMDIRTNLKSALTKTRLRYSYFEFIRTDSEAKTEARQSKLEISPSFSLERWAIGLQNKLVNKFLVMGNTGYLESAPFLKFEGKFIEPKFKVIYRPIAIENDRYSADSSWESNPFYSFDLEANF